MKDTAVGKAFGRVLYDARRARGLTQEDLAAEAEVDRTYPSLLERGHRVPTLAVFFRLCRALRCAPDALITATLQQLVRQGAAPARLFDAHTPPPGLPREGPPPGPRAADTP